MVDFDWTSVGSRIIYVFWWPFYLTKPPPSYIVSIDLQTKYEADGLMRLTLSDDYH